MKVLNIRAAAHKATGLRAFKLEIANIYSGPFGEQRKKGKVMITVE